MSTRRTLDRVTANLEESMGIRGTEGRPTLAPMPAKRDAGRRPLGNVGRLAIDQVLPEIAALQTAACASLSETRRDELIDLLTTFHERLRTIDLDAALDTVPPRNRTRTT